MKSLWSKSERLTDLGNSFKGFPAQRWRIQSLCLCEGQRLSNPFQQRQHPTEALRIPDALVHAVPDGQRIDLSRLVEQHRLCLRWRLDTFSRRRDRTSKVECSRVRSCHSRVEPHAIW